jgi:hypothetical protein
MEKFFDYFSHLKDNAGKLGELSLDIILGEMDSSLVLKNQALEDGKIVEFIIKIGNDWVIVDSKNSVKDSYIKKEIVHVSELYLNKKIKGSAQYTASFGLIFVSDHLLKQVVNNSEIRKLMITYKIWMISPSSFYYQIFILNYLNQNNKFSSPSEFLVIANKIISELNLMRKLASTIDLQLSSLIKNKEELSRKIEVVFRLLQQ